MSKLKEITDKIKSSFDTITKEIPAEILFKAATVASAIGDKELAKINDIDSSFTNIKGLNIVTDYLGEKNIFGENKLIDLSNQLFRKGAEYKYDDPRIDKQEVEDLIKAFDDHNYQISNPKGYSPLDLLISKEHVKELKGKLESQYDELKNNNSLSNLEDNMPSEITSPAYNRDSFLEGIQKRLSTENGFNKDTSGLALDFD